MSDNSSTNILIKIFWQGILLAGLVVAAWVISQSLPGSLNIKKTTPMAVSTAPTPSVSATLYRLPNTGEGPSPLQVIINSVAGAQQSVVVAARQVTSTALLTAMKDRAASGVSVVTLLSPDINADFARTRLAQWMRDNSLTGVYLDSATSASHIIVIDEKTVVLSDLPFSQRAFEASETNPQNSTLGFVTIIQDAKLGAQLAKALRSRVPEANKLL